MRRSLLLAAVAATSMLAAQMARAEVYAYKCDGQTVQLDDAAGTITWNGNVFSNAHVVDDCRFNYRPTDQAGSTDYRAADQAGSTVELCTSTHGYASLYIVAKGKKPIHFECNP